MPAKLFPVPVTLGAFCERNLVKWKVNNLSRIRRSLESTKNSGLANNAPRYNVLHTTWANSNGSSALTCEFSKINTLFCNANSDERFPECVRMLQKFWSIYIHKPTYTRGLKIQTTFRPVGINYDNNRNPTVTNLPTYTWVHKNVRHVTTASSHPFCSSVAHVPHRRASRREYYFLQPAAHDIASLTQSKASKNFPSTYNPRRSRSLAL